MRLPVMLTRWHRTLPGMAVLGVVGVLALTGMSLQVLRVSDARARHRPQAAGNEDTARHQLLQVLAAYDAALSAERGYLLTADAGELTRLHAATQELEQAVAALAASPVWTAPDRAVVDQLVTGARAAAVELDRAVALHDAGQPEAAIALARHGTAIAFSSWMRARIAAMIDDVTQQRLAAQAALRREEMAAFTFAAGGAGFAGLVLLAAGAVMAMQVRARRRNSEAALPGRARARQSADRAKSRYLAAVSHDLRQPLHAITLFIAALRRRSNGQEVDRIVESIATATGAMQRMFTALLDVARLDAGAVMVQPRAFALEELLHTLRARFAPLAAAKGLGLDIPATDLAPWTDPVLLESILNNLLSNAVSFTARGGITLTTRRHDQSLELEVRDTGYGIAADRLDRIFKEFEHFDPAEPSGHGVGLGLAIVRLLADLLGARVAVESIEGTGSAFTLVLPFVPGEAMAPVTAPTPAPDLVGDCASWCWTTIPWCCGRPRPWWPTGARCRCSHTAPPRRWR